MSKKQHRYAHEPLWKRYLPHTLFARAFLILALPVVLLQIIAYVFFYENHWDSVTRNMSRSFSGEVLLLVDLYEQGTPVRYLRENAARMGMSLQVKDESLLKIEDGKGIKIHPEFFDHIRNETEKAFMVQHVGPEEDLEVTIGLRDGKVMQLIASKKRLVSSTTTIFLLWLGGSSFLLVVVATLFLRNQIRPIRQLSRAAVRFGLGRDMPDFSPRGAEEVRQAGRAFVEMRRRIQRYVDSRTEMLAGISHDLRTPLTRMKLQIAMSGLDEKNRAEIEGDIVEMEHMIAEYLDFAKGEGSEQAMRVELFALLEEMQEDYQRQDAPVRVESGTAKPPLFLELKPRAMKRAVQNVINNALHYGKQATLTVTEEKDHYSILVDDNGPGIAEEKMELVFQAFTRLDAARSPSKSGAGLGLSIARDLMQAQGGRIYLENRRNAQGDIEGLRVSLRFPRI